MQGRWSRLTVPAGRPLRRCRDSLSALHSAKSLQRSRRIFALSNSGSCFPGISYGISGIAALEGQAFHRCDSSGADSPGAVRELARSRSSRSCACNVGARLSPFGPCAALCVTAESLVRFLCGSAYGYLSPVRCPWTASHRAGYVPVMAVREPKRTPLASAVQAHPGIHEPRITTGC